MRFPGKILDRQIFINVTGAFLFSIALFMALLLAMDLLPQLLKNIAELGYPLNVALSIFVCRIPMMLVYAFPMSVLLGILLVFNQMSSESEMVAIRAGGVSFARIVAPAVVFALTITALTFWMSNNCAPDANKRAAYLDEIAKKGANPLLYLHIEKERVIYSVHCSNLDIKNQSMHKVTLTFFAESTPTELIYAENAYWNRGRGQWSLPHAYAYQVRPANSPRQTTPLAQDITAHVQQVVESPADLDTVKKATDDYTATEIRAYIARKIAMNKDEHGGIHDKDVGEYKMALSRRFAMPFYCLVFALIAAAMGLHNHRSSAAVGLGISLLILFAFYFTTIYLSTFGQSGCMSTDIAAWTPNVVGGILGVVLIARANR